MRRKYRTIGFLLLPLFTGGIFFGVWIYQQDLGESLPSEMTRNKETKTKSQDHITGWIKKGASFEVVLSLPIASSLQAWEHTMGFPSGLATMLTKLLTQNGWDVQTGKPTYRKEFGYSTKYSSLNTLDGTSLICRAGLLFLQYQENHTILLYQEEDYVLPRFRVKENNGEKTVSLYLSPSLSGEEQAPVLIRKSLTEWEELYPTDKSNFRLESFSYVVFQHAPDSFSLFKKGKGKVPSTFNQSAPTLTFPPAKSFTQLQKEVRKRIAVPKKQSHKKSYLDSLHLRYSHLRKESINEFFAEHKVFTSDLPPHEAHNLKQASIRDFMDTKDIISFQDDIYFTSALPISKEFEEKMFVSQKSLTINRKNFKLLYTKDKKVYYQKSPGLYVKLPMTGSAFSLDNTLVQTNRDGSFNVYSKENIYANAYLSSCESMDDVIELFKKNFKYYNKNLKATHDIILNKDPFRKAKTVSMVEMEENVVVYTPDNNFKIYPKSACLSDQTIRKMGSSGQTVARINEDFIKAINATKDSQDYIYARLRYIDFLNVIQESDGKQPLVVPNPQTPGKLIFIMGSSRLKDAVRQNNLYANHVIQLNNFVDKEENGLKYIFSRMDTLYQKSLLVPTTGGTNPHRKALFELTDNLDSLIVLPMFSEKKKREKNLLLGLKEATISHEIIQNNLYQLMIILKRPTNMMQLSMDISKVRTELRKEKLKATRYKGYGHNRMAMVLENCSDFLLDVMDSKIELFNLRRTP